MMNLSTLITAVFPIGAIGLTTYVSKLKNSQVPKINYILKYFIRLNIIGVFVVIIILIFFSEKLSTILLGAGDYQIYILLFLISLPLSLIFSFIDIYLRGIRQINKYVLLISISSLVNLFIYIPLVIYFKLTGAIIGLIIAPLISCVIGFFILKKNALYPNFKDVEVAEKKIKVDIIKIGLSSSIILLIQNLIYLFIRTSIIKSLGESQAGIFQSIFAISNNYFSIFFSLMAIYSIPKISEMIKSEDKINEINQTLKFMLILYTPMILIFYIFRYYIIILLYSDSFLPAESLLFFQLLGDFFKVLGWVFGLWLIPSMKIKAWFIFDFIFYTIFFCVFYVLFYFYSFGLKSAPIAYLIAYIIHFVINLIYIFYSLRFKFKRDSARVVIISTFVIIINFFVSSIFKQYGYYLIFPSLAIWGYFIFEKHDFDNIKKLLFRKDQ